jgi:N-acetyl-alpha-D-muramate 1-phosphate uridylyltransferase
VKTAMILAAGRGERLKPLTDSCPKSLCPVGKEPLIVHHIYRLQHAGIENIVINHAWLGGKIRQFLGNGHSFGVNIAYSAEPPGGLETGGGIVQALPLLGDETFICVNADIYCDFDFSQLINLEGKGSIYLVLVKNPEHNPKGDFGIDHPWVTLHPKTHTFSGIALYHPRDFLRLSRGRFSLAPWLLAMVNQRKVKAISHSGIWIDIGCKQRLEEANQSART